MNFLGRVSVALTAMAALLACAAASAQAASPSDWMYEPTTFAEIRLELPQASYQLLEDEEYDEYVEGEFSLAETDGTPGSPGPFSTPIKVGVKLKGGAGSRRDINHKAGLKIKFDEVVENQTFYGLEKMTLNNMIQDPASIHETLAYQGFHEMDVFAPRTGFAYVWVNGKSYGLHLNVETPDKIALEKTFGPFQNPPQHLYEGEYEADVSSAGWHGTAEPRWEKLEVDEGKSKQKGDLEAFVAAVEGPSGTFSERVANYADLPEMTRMWAVEKYVEHWDGYSGAAIDQNHPNNYYFYSDPSGRFQMFPWGTDQTWEASRNVEFDGPGGVLFEACHADSACWDLFLAAAQQALAKFSAPGLATTARCSAAAVNPWREYEETHSEPEKKPPWSPQTTRDWQQQTAELVAARPADLADFLEVATPPPAAEQPCSPLRPIGGFKEPEPIVPAPVPPADTTTTPNPPPADAGPAAVSPPRFGSRSVGANAVRVELRDLGAGWLSLRGTFNVEGKQATACRAKGRQVAAGAVVLACRLTQRLKNRLDHGAAYLRLTATLTPAAGPAQSSTRTLRLPSR